MHGTLLNVFIPETDLDVTAVKVARTLHVTLEIYKQTPGSLPLYYRKPKATVTLHDQENAPLLQWLDSVTKQNEGKRVERAKGIEPGVPTE